MKSSDFRIRHTWVEHGLLVTALGRLLHLSAFVCKTGIKKTQHSRGGRV